MPYISPGFLAAALLAAALMNAAPLTHAWASSASGHAVVQVGDDVLRIVSFSATSINPEEGTATGQIDFHDPQPIVDQDVDGTGDPALADARNGVRVQANVDCLAVEGDQAIVGGQVTSATVDRYVGMWVVLYVQDDSSGTPAKFTWGFYPTETDTGCGSFPFVAYDAVDIESGNLRVQQ